MIADFPQKVGFLTRELAAFHEAAHIFTAIKTGALVHRAELINEPHPHGRSRIERNDAFQGICVACAGFAAEYELLEKGIM